VAIAPLKKMLLGLESLDLEKEIRGRDVPPSLSKFIITKNMNKLNFYCVLKIWVQSPIYHKRTNLISFDSSSILKTLIFDLKG